MVGGILQASLILVAIVSTSQPTEKNGVYPENDQEIAERMKERQVTLGQHQLQLEKEMAELEGRQEPLAWPQWEEEIKMPWQTQCTVLGLLVPAVLVIWGQRRDGARAREPGEEEPEPGFLGKICHGLAFLTEPFLLLRAIGILMGTAVAWLPFFADRLADLALKLVRSHKKKWMFEIP